MTKSVDLISPIDGSVYLSRNALSRDLVSDLVATLDDADAEPASRRPVSLAQFQDQLQSNYPPLHLATATGFLGSTPEQRRRHRPESPSLTLDTALDALAAVTQHPGGDLTVALADAAVGMSTVILCSEAVGPHLPELPARVLWLHWHDTGLTTGTTGGHARSATAGAG